jgi:hypothetical protein
VWNNNYKNTLVSDNYLNFYFLNEFNTSTFFNFKNVFINYTVNNYNFFQPLNNNFLNKSYNIQLNTKTSFYQSLILDFSKLVENLNPFYITNNSGFNIETYFSNFYLNNFFKNTLSYNSLPVSFFKNSLFSYNTWFFFIVLVLLISFITYFFAFLIFIKNSNLFNSENLYDEYNTTTNYIIESEKELGSLDDMFLGVSILICIYAWFFYGTIFFHIFYNTSNSYIYMGFPFLLVMILGMPTNMIWNYGLTFSSFLRGSSNTTIILLEFMYDILAASIMYIRLIVQNVRFILMFFAFFECYEFFLNNVFITKSYYFYYIDFSSLDSSLKMLYNFCIFFILYLYNICHLIYTIISHFFAYLILVFWFFSFLYTTFLEEKMENSFKKNKKE